MATPLCCLFLLFAVLVFFFKCLVLFVLIQLLCWCWWWLTVVIMTYGHLRDDADVELCWCWWWSTVVIMTHGHLRDDAELWLWQWQKTKRSNTINVLTATMIMTVTMIVASNDCVWCDQTSTWWFSRAHGWRTWCTTSAWARQSRARSSPRMLHLSWARAGHLSRCTPPPR